MLAVSTTLTVNTRHAAFRATAPGFNLQELR
jgi:hypothetical protein